MKHRREGREEGGTKPRFSFSSSKWENSLFLQSQKMSRVSVPPTFPPPPPQPPNGCGFLWPVFLTRQLFRLAYKGDRMASEAKCSSCRDTIYTFFRLVEPWCVKCAALESHPCLQVTTLESMELFEEVIQPHD